MTNSNDALRACPFCGDSAAMEVDEDEFEIARGICGNCGACGPFVDLSEYSSIAEAKDAAGAAWNRRPSPVAGGDLREAVARIIAAGNHGDPWWWKEAFDDGADETAVRLRKDDVAVADDVLAALNQPAAPVEAVEALYPSLELCVQFSDDGQHIRKWSRIPFDGGTDFYSHPPEPAASTVAQGEG